MYYWEFYLSEKNKLFLDPSSREQNKRSGLDDYCWWNKNNENAHWFESILIMHAVKRLSENPYITICVSQRVDYLKFEIKSEKKGNISNLNKGGGGVPPLSVK